MHRASHRGPTAARTPRRTALALAFALLSTLPAGAVPLERLSSPRPAHWVLDTTGTLSRDDVTRIDARIEALRLRTGGEVVVVVIDSTDGMPSAEYAPKLANSWLVGDQARRDGVLILIAKADRRVEIALGKGIAGERQSAITQDILDRFMAPRLRAGDLQGGIFAGLQGVAERIFDDPGGPREPPESAATRSAPAAREGKAEPPERESGLPWGIFAAMTLALLLGGAYLLGRLRRRETKGGRNP